MVLKCALIARLPVAAAFTDERAVYGARWIFQIRLRPPAVGHCHANRRRKKVEGEGGTFRSPLTRREIWWRDDDREILAIHRGLV